jgi:hypothetical protein
VVKCIKESYQQLKRLGLLVIRYSWYDIIVLNIHAPSEDKTVDVKDSFYEELECAVDKFDK